MLCQDDSTCEMFDFLNSGIRIRVNRYGVMIILWRHVGADEQVAVYGTRHFDHPNSFISIFAFINAIPVDDGSSFMSSSPPGREIVISLN